MNKIALACIALCLSLEAGAASSTEPVTIKVGWAVLTSSAVPLALEKKEQLPHYGKSYTIEPVPIRSTSAMITALAAGEVDVGTLAYSSLAFAIENAKLADIRVIMDVMQDGVDDAGTGHFMVLKDGPIKTVEDLRGKVIASFAAGTAVDIAIRAMLRRHGLDPKKDVNIIEAAFPNMKSLLLERKADLVATAEPYASDPALLAAARDLFTQKEATGVTQLLVWAGRAGFIADHRAAMVDFLQDSLGFVHYMTDPAHHEEMVERVAKDTKQSPDVLRSWLFTSKDFYRDPRGLPNLAALQANIDLAHDMGFLDQTINVKDYTDLTLIKEADARSAK